MFRKYLLFIILAVAAVLPGCECSCRGHDLSRCHYTAACANLDALLTANNTFSKMKVGLSLDKPYHGYCIQTIDLFEAKFETENGTECIKGIDKHTCAVEGKNGLSGGYYYRYFVMETSKNEDGLDNVTSFMIVAWPKEIGKTGAKVYVICEQGTIFARPARPGEEGPEPPFDYWPDVDSDDSEWKAVS